MPSPSVKKYDEMESSRLIWPNGLSHGLARVVLQASLHSDAWGGWREIHLHEVNELPLGMLTICLPPIESDAGWASVIAVLNDRVYHTFVHPESLAPVGSVSNEPALTVGCAHYFGSQSALATEAN